MPVATRVKVLSKDSGFNENILIITTIKIDSIWIILLQVLVSIKLRPFNETGFIV